MHLDKDKQYGSLLSIFTQKWKDLSRPIIPATIYIHVEKHAEITQHALL